MTGSIEPSQGVVVGVVVPDVVVVVLTAGEARRARAPVAQRGATGAGQRPRVREMRAESMCVYSENERLRPGGGHRQDSVPSTFIESEGERGSNT